MLFLHVVAGISASPDSFFFLLNALPAILGLNHVTGYLSAQGFVRRVSSIS